MSTLGLRLKLKPAADISSEARFLTGRSTFSRHLCVPLVSIVAIDDNGVERSPSAKNLGGIEAELRRSCSLASEACLIVGAVNSRRGTAWIHCLLFPPQAIHHGREQPALEVALQTAAVLLQSDKWLPKGGQCMVWHGVAWRGMAWRGVAWRGMAWHGVRLCCYPNSTDHLLPQPQQLPLSRMC